MGGNVILYWMYILDDALGMVNYECLHIFDNSTNNYHGTNTGKSKIIFKMILPCTELILQCGLLLWMQIDTQCQFNCL